MPPFSLSCPKFWALEERFHWRSKPCEHPHVNCAWCSVFLSVRIFCNPDTSVVSHGCKALCYILTCSTAKKQDTLWSKLVWMASLGLSPLVCGWEVELCPNQRVWSHERILFYLCHWLNESTNSPQDVQALERWELGFVQVISVSKAHGEFLYLLSTSKPIDLILIHIFIFFSQIQSWMLLIICFAFMFTVRFLKSWRKTGYIHGFEIYQKVQ